MWQFGTFDNKLLGTFLSSQAFAGNFFSSKTIYENFDNKFRRQQQPPLKYFQSGKFTKQSQINMKIESKCKKCLLY